MGHLYSVKKLGGQFGKEILKFLTVIFILCPIFQNKSFGQIASDGLNNSATLFTITGGGSYYTGNSAGGDRPATTPFFVEGTHSYGVSNTSATLTSSTINTIGFTGIQMQFRLASFSISSTGNGADASDIVTTEVSPDGGTNWYSTVRVLGAVANNAYWGFATGTGNASTAYDGNATPIDFAPAGGGARTTDGYSTVTITGLPAVTNLRIRITMGNNSTGERWLIDDVRITGTSSLINYYWNGSNATPYSAIWNNTDINWTSPTATTGALNAAWPAAGTTNAANFLTGGGTVSLSGGTIASSPSAVNIGTNFIFSSVTPSTLNSPVALAGGANLSLTGAGPSGEIILPGVISGAGTLNFTSTGTGAVTLNGNNTFTGAKTLTSGTLNLGHVNALGVSGTWNINGGTITNTTGAAMTLPVYPQAWSGTFFFAGSNDLNMGTGAVSLSATEVNIASGRTLTVGGVISGSPILTKAGAGNLLLTGSNTYNGGTMINAGTLTLGSTTTLADATPVILNGGTLKSGTTTGFSETMGTLELLENSTIALGSGNHTLIFANSSAVSWTPAKTLTITGWTGTAGTAGNPGGKIIVGSGGLTASQLAQVTFSGFGPGAIIVSGELVPAPVAIDFVNLQFPGTANVTVSNAVTVYAQAYEPGVTEAAGQASSITAWIGVNTANTDPSTWNSTVWIPATFNVQAGNNDEFRADIGAALAPGTYYYASRFLITGGLYQYGGFNGGAWNGTSNINGTLTVNDNTVDFCNIQNSSTGSILRGGGFNIYSQVYEPGMTEAVGANPAITAWIGYNTSNTNPNTAGWTWVPVSYNLQAGNNDEYMLDLGATLAAVGPGTYYYASRYQVGSGSYQYGGTGGVWSNNSGVLNIADVKGNGISIAYQGTSTSATNNTDFGNACIGAPVVKTFTISNNSTTNTLSFGAVTITGANAADFTVTAAPVSPVAASGSTSFQVSFSAGGAGARNATVNVATDAAVYSFSITGTGQATPVINTQPSSQVVTSPAAATFTINAAGGTGVFQWQWYDGASWTNLTNTAPYSGVTTSTLTVNPTTVSYNDYEFRCIVRANTPCGDVISNSAVLTVNPGPCITEEFNGGISAPTGWTFSGISGTYPTGGNYGVSSPSIRFDDTNDHIITYNTGSNATQLSFWLKGQGTNAVSALLVEGWNGIAWVTIENIVPLPTTGTVKTYNSGTIPALPSGLSQFRFTYTKGAGNLAFDDVTVSCTPTACTPTATISSFLPASGPVATIVTITGTGFTGATDVTFGGLSAAAFTVVNATTITAEVPSGAGTGKVSVTVGSCDAVSGSDFTVIAQSGTCAVSGSGSTVNDISISEVYDAFTGSLSYIELFNGTGSTVDLASGNYVLRITTGTSTNTDYPLTGSIVSGGTYLIRLGTGTICSGVTPDLDEPSASGFNGNDRIYLRKNGADIDYVPNPNYGSTDKPGFSQYRKAVTTAPTIPSTTYTASDWVITTTENCSNLSTAPYSLTGSAINITAHPADVSCDAISFSVTATGSGTGSTTYLWKYYNTATNTWENASGITNAALGVTASGTSTATMTITGNTAHLLNYQFYCEIERGSCIIYSNAAQYTYSTRLVYRSKVATGNWTDTNTWEMTDDEVNGPWIPVCAYPNAVNSQSVIIAAGNTITLDLDNKVNRLSINAGATLIDLANAELSVLNGNASGADLTVTGTFIDEANSANSIVFEGGATWTLGSSATLIKSSTSYGSRYRDHYETGIVNIPATANWVYRYNNPAVTVLDFVSSSAGSVMYYPNLTLENTISGNTHSSVFNATTPQFSDFTITGVTNPLHIKGNFDVGGTGPGFINFLNINSISPVFVAGNTIIRTGSTLRNNGDATNNGSGFDLKGDLIVDGTLINNGGAANTGLLRFSGILPQTISGTGTMDLENVDINNTAAGIVHVNRNFSVPGVLSFGSALAKLHLNTGIITIKSSSTRTAQVGSIPPGTLITYGTSGGFEIERYLPALKGWRFISTPVSALTSPTITEAWREGGSTASTGYGTQITGPEGAANGFDAVTPGYSMKWYDAATGNYTMVTNTSGTLANDAGYMLFVRGDRSIGVAGTTGETNLRIKGQIRTGPQLFPVPANSFQSIGNPYPSRISFPDLLAGNPADSIGTYYVAWDPSIAGSYNAGGYQVLSSLNGYEGTVSGSALYPVGSQHPDIESGQAFYIFSTTTLPWAVTIDENMKTTGSRIASRENTPEDRQFLRTKLYTNTGNIADGNMVAFDDELSNDLDRDDAPKFINSGENFGMSRFGKKFSVEARNRVQVNDTIHYHMSNLKEQQYKITISPEKLAATGMEGWFIDRFLNTQTPVSLASSTDITITITSNAASKAANRFFLVFKPLAGPLPVTFVSVAAQRQADRSIAIKWKVANEINIDHYEVERSANGTQFTGILSNDAQGITDYNKNDLSPLAADNFYRIKAVGIAGDITYSSIVKVAPDKQGSLITVMPNPVKGKQVNIRFNDQPEGEYTLQLSNVSGQLLYAGVALVENAAQVKTITLPQTVAGGNYLLIIRSKEGKTIHSETLIVE